MNQQGYIVEIVDSVTAKLKLKRHFACASCGKCATTSEEKYIIVEADNTIGAKVGDRVEVNGNCKCIKSSIYSLHNTFISITFRNCRYFLWLKSNKYHK